MHSPRNLCLCDHFQHGLSLENQDNACALALATRNSPETVPNPSAQTKAFLDTLSLRGPRL